MQACNTSPDVTMSAFHAQVQIGDKRWFKGAAKEGTGVYNSFVVA